MKSDQYLKSFTQNFMKIEKNDKTRYIVFLYSMLIQQAYNAYLFTTIWAKILMKYGLNKCFYFFIVCTFLISSNLVIIIRKIECLANIIDNYFGKGVHLSER